MAYNPLIQFRCDIVRTRAKKYIDDILISYAKIIHDVCPCSEDDFVDEFNSRLSVYLTALGQSVNTKALNNHRTETAKTLFGMYYIDTQKVVYETERTQKFLKDNDQPAFFKDICYKLQFPNGMTANKTLDDRILAKIKCYPCRLVLAVLQEAQTSGIKLTVRDIGYYVLNSLDALSGKATPNEIVKAVDADRKAGITRSIVSGKNDPWDWEHITGILNYMFLANLIEYSNARNARDREITLNVHEAATIKIFVSGYSDPLEFDVYDSKKYPRTTIQERKDFQLEWDKYQGTLSKYASHFYTLPSCLGITTAVSTGRAKKYAKFSTAAIGKAGEAYVEKYEKDLLGKINPAYKSRVINKAALRGIGYDIESVEIVGAALGGTKYIEVKTTTRVTPPTTKSFIDVVNLTRNEMNAAKTYMAAFYVYRVYLTKGKVYIYQLKNIHGKKASGLVDIDAPIYEMRFDLCKTGVIDKAAVI